MTPGPSAPTVADEINRQYVRNIVARTAGTRFSFRRRVVMRLQFGRETQMILYPLLYVLAPLVALYLALSTPARRPPTARAGHYARAAGHLRLFVRQYPFHLYPLLVKAVELVYLRSVIRENIDQRTGVVELAIGEGTLSRQLFETDHRVTAIDLSPYSLFQTAGMPHISARIVGDAMDPPIQEGAFDILVSNNFLHHVEDKSGTLRNWANKARTALFNENTPYWASSWTVPYVLRGLGLGAWSRKSSDRIEAKSVQRLQTIDVLTRTISDNYEIVEQFSFLSERTFFLCSLFSFLLRCLGPPTPALAKRLSLGPFAWGAIPLTYVLGKLLLHYDLHQDRSRDTFIVFLCRSRRFRERQLAGVLACPACRGVVDDRGRCAGCAKQYEVRDGMLFLLPPELDQIRTAYSRAEAQATPTEHL
jgi:hypothetical protein